LGLVGVGRIGGRLAGVCRSAVRMRVLAYDPYVSAERARELGGGRREAVEPGLRGGGLVAVHAPPPPETRHVVDAARLRLMKPTAFLINCARGGLVDEAALAEALRAGTIAGAGIDTFDQEPPDPSNELLRLPSCVVTPHVAGGSQEAR